MGPPYVPSVSSRRHLPSAWCRSYRGAPSTFPQFWRHSPIAPTRSAPAKIANEARGSNNGAADSLSGHQLSDSLARAKTYVSSRCSVGPPVIYQIAGVLSLPSIRGAVQEMLRRTEFGGVVIDTRTSPTNIRNDLTAQVDSLLVIRADGSTESVRSTLVTEDFLGRVLNDRRQ